MVAPAIRLLSDQEPNVEVRRLPIHNSRDRKSTRLNSSHLVISYAVFCLKKKKNKTNIIQNIHSSPLSNSSLQDKPQTNNSLIPLLPGTIATTLSAPTRPFTPCIAQARNT